MSIALDIHSERLAAAIAAATGKPVETIVREALEARASSLGVATATVGPLDAEERFRLSVAIADRCAARPLLDSRTADEIIGYDSIGLPA